MYERVQDPNLKRKDKINKFEFKQKPLWKEVGRRESTRRSERVMKANLLLSTARLRVLTMSSPAKRKYR